jgi:hypothetical protein
MHSKDLEDTLITALRYRMWAQGKDYSAVEDVPEPDAYSMWCKVGKPRNIQLMGAGYYIIEQSEGKLSLRVWDEGNSEEQQAFLRGAYKRIGESGKELTA